MFLIWISLVSRGDFKIALGTHLSAIELGFRKYVQIILVDLGVCCLQEVKKDAFPCCRLQIVILQLKMNSVQDCIVKVAHQVGREKEDPIIIFELTEKYGHQAVPLQLDRTVFLHKHIHFIKQENRIPEAGDSKDSSELFFQHRSFRAQLSRRNLSEGC